MKDKKTTGLILSIVIILLGLIIWELNKKQPTDWAPSFINTSKEPYGTFIVYNLLSDIFSKQDIEVSRLPISNQLKYITDEYDDDGYYDDSETEVQIDPENLNQSYIFININFNVDNLDKNNLLKFVEAGNNVFIASEIFDNNILDSLGIKLGSEWNVDSVYSFKERNNTKKYTFSEINIQHYFTEKDSTNTSFTTLVENQDKQPVFIKVKHGEGYLYLNTLPIAFSNISLINLNKYDFAFRCLSYLPKDDSIIWDEYQKQGPLHEESTLRVIRKHPPLLFAYYILIGASILFLIFRAKRDQRIIPVVIPPKNTSLEFLNTLSNLYYQKDAHRSIVEKRHSYLLEQIRERYYIKTEIFDESFFDILHQKSTVDKDIIKSIFKLYTQISIVKYMDNNLFIQYNEKLEDFYKKMK